MHKRKGQAAMEFLMTYGWAILAAIIAIGVLAYFGVFNAGNLAGSSAIINNPFFVDTWLVTTSGVFLEMVNNGGSTLNVSTVTVTGTGTSDGITCTLDTTQLGESQAAGELKLYNVTAGCTPVSGESYAGNIVVSYTKSGSALNLESTGTIRASIQ